MLYVIDYKLDNIMIWYYIIYLLMEFFGAADDAIQKKGGILEKVAMIFGIVMFFIMLALIIYAFLWYFII